MGIFRIGHKRIMSQIRGTLNKAYKDCRLKFPEGTVEYTEKDGMIHIFLLDQCAAFFWDKFSNQLMGGTGMSSANLATVDISPDDIKAVLLEIKEKGKAK